MVNLSLLMSLSNSDTDLVTIHDLLVDGASKGIQLQREDGSFPQREPSYYGDTQFPIRTTAQWLRVFAEVHSLTGDERYKKAADRAASYLLSESARPHGFTFHCRDVDDKDSCNGVFGQAIPIWALSIASERLDDDHLMDTAREVANLHTYESELALWNRVEINGEILPIDRTLNHQVAFAAALSHVDDSELQSEVKHFLDSFLQIAGIHSNGTIRHLVNTPIYSRTLSTGNKKAVFRNKILYEAYNFLPSMKRKEISYHPLNLFWLSQLKKNFPDHSLWHSEYISLATQIIEKNRFEEQLAQTDMAFSISVSGFYLGIASLVFNSSRTAATEWIEKQIEIAYDISEDSLASDIPDPGKMASNICYLAEFPAIQERIKVEA